MTRRRCRRGMPDDDVEQGKKEGVTPTIRSMRIRGPAIVASPSNLPGTRDDNRIEHMGKEAKAT